MKVKSLLIAAFAALSMSAVAGTFARDNVYIKDFEAKVGDEVTVDIYFDCETEYAAAQADFYFPEGITPVEYKAKNGSRKLLAIVGTKTLLTPSLKMTQSKMKQKLVEMNLTAKELFVSCLLN